MRRLQDWLLCRRTTEAIRRGYAAEFDNEKVSNIAKNSFGVSGTFRKGKIGAWKDFFSHSDKELYKSKIGDLLIDIGYESDKNW